jgi:hypothetical protein
MLRCSARNSVDDAYPNRLEFAGQCAPERNAVKDYDYIVVRVGTAGCVVAGRLAQDPATRLPLPKACRARRTRATAVPRADGMARKLAALEIRLAAVRPIGTRCMGPVELVAADPHLKVRRLHRKDLCIDIQERTRR